jgi:hypothetical protein
MSSMVNSWGLGSSSLGYATSYANPYYGAETATVASASPYDYSQPIVVNNYITSDGGSATNSAQGGDGQGGDGGAGTAAAQVTPAQAEANKSIAQAQAEIWRAAAVAVEQEMKARVQEMQAKVVEAQAQVPLALAEAFRSGRLGVMDYYKMENIQADTSMRKVIGTDERK